MLCAALLSVDPCCHNVLQVPSAIFNPNGRPLQTVIAVYIRASRQHSIHFLFALLVINNSTSVCGGCDYDILAGTLTVVNVCQGKTNNF